MSGQVPILYLASNNAHKAEELGAMLKGRFDVRLAKELKPGIGWEETGETFEANARIKAEAVRQYTRERVLADDSGLMVDALRGAPGVLSARFAGKDGDDAANNAKLLQEIDPLPDRLLTARFVCVLHYVDQEGNGHTFRGECPGRIVKTPRGAQGFGYDPLFLVDGTDQTMAELPADQKNAVSHRRRALDQWLEFLGAR
jgi:non-canonical purine NTP pyrophosphatase (RdgB/HAM1 family)